MKNSETYLLISKILQYPELGYEAELGACSRLIEEHYPKAVVDFGKLKSTMESLSLHRLQEIYTRTFHIQAICYLDLGYVMFGEDYKRGAFLVNMKSEMQEAGVDTGIELADNLTNVLKLMVVHQDPKFIEELTHMVLLPSIDQMLSEFDSSRIALKQKVLRKKHRAILQENEINMNLYQSLLLALKHVIQTDFYRKTELESKPDPLLAGLNHLYCNGCAPATQSFLGKQK